jgi:hypothetical protein
MPSQLAAIAQRMYQTLKAMPCACGDRTVVVAGKSTRVHVVCARCHRISEYELVVPQ